MQIKSKDASKHICERSLYGSVTPDPPHNCYMFWCKLHADVFRTSVPSVTCGILACSPLDQVSRNQNRHHIHHGQQLGTVTHQRAGRLSALTATETFAENKPPLPARAVKGPELLTGSGSQASSPGKCHLKSWKRHLQDFRAQRHITHPTPSPELKRQSWRYITVLKGWDTDVLFEQGDGGFGPLDTTFQVTVKNLIASLTFINPLYPAAHAKHVPSTFMFVSCTIPLRFPSETTCHRKITSKDEQKPDVSRNKQEKIL